MGNPFASVGLASHYSRFRVANRLLLTGHSHQAWPDVAFDAQQKAWLDAAALVDEKWERAATVANDVRTGWRRLLNDPSGDLALGANTHELVVRLLSAVLPMFRPAQSLHPASPTGLSRLRSVDAARASARQAGLITTDGEFHTIRRQVDRFAEEGVPVIKVATQPADTLSERLAATVDGSTACVLVSSVLFETGEIVPNLEQVARACAHHGAVLLVDAYHHLNIVPFNLEAMGLTEAFVVGGGYKYCQLGEGNCFLRVPPGSELRPVLTGWFSEFAELADAAHPGEVRYGKGAARFAGATYDPTSHYRAAAVFAFHQRMGMTPERLRAVSQQQTAMLVKRFEALDVDPAVAALIPIRSDRRAGFLAIRAPQARSLVLHLRARGLYADSRGDILRLGPAPYISDQQLIDAGGILASVFR
jgi:kynureninase